jgi:putative transcriptional regulator
MDDPREPLDAPEVPSSGTSPEEPERPAEPGPGTLLAANEILEDPNFRNAIVLLCRHDADGAYGLVLNRPAHMPLREVFENPPKGPEGTSGSRRVYIGGPVQPEELQVLDLAEDPVAESVAVAPGVHVGGRWDSLESILSRPASSLRLFLGYAGWGPGQLEDEIAEGAWEVRSADLRLLLETPDETWAADPEALRRYLEMNNEQ